MTLSASKLTALIHTAAPVKQEKGADISTFQIATEVVTVYLKTVTGEKTK